MSAPVPLTRTTTVDAFAAAVRRRILDGELAPGTPLREQRLAADYAVARHTVRAGLRALAAEGLAVVEPHRGVHVRALHRADLEALGELRIALETEAARLALARHGGVLPRSVHAAGEAFAAACAALPTGVVEVTGDMSRKPRPPHDGTVPEDARHPAATTGFAAVTDAHEALHHALVVAGGSPRITAAHAALAGEQRLFLAALRPEYDLPALARDHLALLDALDRDGPDALRAHVADSTARLAARLRD